MSDTIGRITVPDSAVDSGLTFPLITDYGYGFSQSRTIITHQFGSGSAKVEQRFRLGIGLRLFTFQRARMSYRDRKLLLNFWEDRNGAWEAFTYNAPGPDSTTESVLVNFTSEPETFEHFANACRTGLKLIEAFDPSTAPVYTVSDTVLRFPSGTLQAQLLLQVQEIIPLIHIRVREGAVDDIYLADRRCTIGSQLYLPRLIDIGEPGSSILLSQDIRGSADNLQFSFGNADAVMTQLANDTDLKFATIDLCFYDVSTGILCQLWKGSILNYLIDGSPKFQVQSSDGLYLVSQQYPLHTVSRFCWKTFNDALNCPWATMGSGGDPLVCDYTFDGTKGCTSHGMGDYFGGHAAQPQGVNIKDNSTGTWGLGRNTVTATSIVADTVWGKALQEIWCNDDGDAGKSFPVNCMVVAVRDESDFVDGLGIIGAGPIGQFTGMLVYTNADGFKYIVAPMIDGVPPHGFKVDGSLTVTSDTTLGLREVAGNDPQSAFFALSALTGPDPPERAAGTAFAEIRRVDAKGIQPSIPDSHTMTVPISKGLTGFTWDGGGSRSSEDGLTNPIWIAVNSLLRCLGQFAASSGTQQSFFSLADAVSAAADCDTVVTPLVGSGTEKQFRFQGVIGQQKPFRDWLTEILASCLGYFTWTFGKLKLACRVDASAVDTFGPGNTLFQSLRLQPIEASFEKLIIDFADQAYAYQGNVAEYTDKSHAAYYGRTDAAAGAPMHLVGCGTQSQALRIAAVRVREEIGGVSAVEWKSARLATWKTTLLALNTEVGQVVSYNDPSLPGARGTCQVFGTSVLQLSGDTFDSLMVGLDIRIGDQVRTITAVTDSTHATIGISAGPVTGAYFQVLMSFRIQSWKLMRDWSVEITAKTVTPSMYDLTRGTVSVQTTPGNIPPPFYNLGGNRTLTAGSTTAVITDNVVLGDTSGGEVDYHLLPGASVLDRRLLIQKITADANVVKIIADTVLPDTVDGAAFITLTRQWEEVELKATATGWIELRGTSVGLSVSSFGYFLMTIAANAVTPDLTNGNFQEVILNQTAQITINNPIWTGGTIAKGQELTIIVSRDSSSAGVARPTPAWGTNFLGVTGWEIARDTATRNTFKFVWTGTKWALQGEPLIGNL